MPASEPSRSAPNLTRRNDLIDLVESAALVAARDQASWIALDEALQALRREHTRTMALVRRQRTTPVYRRAVYHAAL